MFSSPEYLEIPILTTDANNVGAVED